MSAHIVCLFFPSHLCQPIAVSLWTHAACARHDKVVVHKVHVVAASTPACSDVGPHPLQLVLVVLLLGSNYVAHSLMWPRMECASLQGLSSDLREGSIVAQ